MHLFGLVSVGYMWVRMMKKAQEKLAAGEGKQDFYKTKLITGKFFMERLMPETEMRVKRISTGSDTMMALDEALF